jgi:NADP-dependent 3-hydroxy acid dehydrogenase YdfG
MTTVTSEVPTLIASRAFRMGDQEAFAEFSGDFNPMHLSADAARRTQAGAPAVHGMHQVLWILEQLSRLLPSDIGVIHLRARFPNFLLVNEDAHLSFGERTDDTIRLNIATRGVTCTNLVLTLCSPRDGRETPALAAAENTERYRICRDCTFDDVQSASGDLPLRFGAEEARLLFPGACAVIGSAQVTAIAALSHLVGMVCPGLHSIFSSMDIRFVEVKADTMRFSVTFADRRYSFLGQSIRGGGIEGRIETFLRTPPVSQPTVNQIQRFVAAGEFSKSTALVVGASRGLGEVTAKAISSGGGRVIGTYHVSRDQCKRVADEIGSCGGICDILSYDVRRPAASQLELMPALPKSIYYFATTKIFARQNGLYDGERFSEFVAVYLKGFFDLCLHFKSRGVERLAILYPSSIAVESRPADMGVYAMAKAAGEVLCDEIKLRWPEFRVIVRRLPRILTDQTTTVLTVNSPPVEDVLLPIIREVENESRGEDRMSAPEIE